MEDPSIIKQQVQDIEKYIKDNKKRKNAEEFDKEIKIVYEDFYLKYPALFSKIIDGTLEKNQFNFMLNMLGKVKNEELSDHDASVQVGQVLVDKYVKPLIDEKK